MNYAAYFVVEKKLQGIGFDYTRDEVIELFTKGKKSSLKELSHWEYKELLNWMNTMLPHQNDTVKDEYKRCNAMRRKIIAILCKMGYKTADGMHADMQRIGEWATKYGKNHKQLNDYTYKELTELVTQAELMYNKFLKAI